MELFKILRTRSGCPFTPMRAYKDFEQVRVLSSVQPSIAAAAFREWPSQIKIAKRASLVLTPK